MLEAERQQLRPVVGRLPRPAQARGRDRVQVPSKRGGAYDRGGLKIAGSPSTYDAAPTFATGRRAVDSLPRRITLCPAQRL